MKPMLYQEWLESERGWGIRPDGFSLHISQKHLDKFVEAYWETMPPVAPDDYSRPDGKPKLIQVDDQLYKTVEEQGGSMRSYDRELKAKLKT